MSFWGSPRKRKIVVGSDIVGKIAEEAPLEKEEGAQGDSSVQRTFSNHPAFDSFHGGAVGKLRIAVNESNSLQGSFCYDTSIRIDGKIKGDLFSSGTVHIGSSAAVDASLCVNALIVEGVMRGEIRASRSIEIRSGGVLEARITTPALIVQEGGIFLGEGSVNVVETP